MAVLGIPVRPINVNAVNLCALSAHTRPRTRTRSKFDSLASRALAAASRSRLTFCCGVSPGGPGGVRFEGGSAEEGGGRAVAWGVVGVKRVASAGDFGILGNGLVLNDMGKERRRYYLHLKFWDEVLLGDEFCMMQFGRADLSA